MKRHFPPRLRLSPRPKTTPFRDGPSRGINPRLRIHNPLKIKWWKRGGEPLNDPIFYRCFRRLFGKTHNIFSFSIFGVGGSGSGRVRRLVRKHTPNACRAAPGFLKFGEIPSPPAAISVKSLSMSPEKDKSAQEPASIKSPASSVTVPADPDDDFNEPLGERQPDANDAIVCEGGCQ
jgi:hypothetical protein